MVGFAPPVEVMEPPSVADVVVSEVTGPTVRVGTVTPVVVPPEQAGVVKVFENSEGTQSASTFLDIKSKVS